MGLPLEPMVTSSAPALPEEGGLATAAAAAAGSRLQTRQPRCLDPRTRGAEIQIHLLSLTA